MGLNTRIPIDADLVFDISLLAKSLLPSGSVIRQVRTRRFMTVVNHEESEDFLPSFASLVEPILPGYKKEGKSVTTIAVGCTVGSIKALPLPKHSQCLASIDL